MASLKQITANRANARRSTGPRTDAGKARSRLNAWKHGISAEQIVIVDEDPADFEALRAELWREWQPVGALEIVLLDRLAVYEWRLRRVPGFEESCLGMGAFNYPARLSLLSRYETGLLNAFNRALQQLLVLQERRRLEEEMALPPPANDDVPHG